MTALHSASGDPGRTTPPDRLRAVYTLGGTVQGVGFRPAVYRLATAAGLGGGICNEAGRVRLELEGTATEIAAFMATLPDRLPPHAHLTTVERHSLEPLPPGYTQPPFCIHASAGTAEPAFPAIPPDLAMCADCRREVFTPGNLRHGYAFTTCTACGPRYTVVTAMPYDRARTTLASFVLCPACAQEYGDPADRRFHAESTACPVCGPALRLLQPDGTPLPGDPLAAARAALAAGALVAVRGLGGFLLACNAHSRPALERLRQRKRRPAKPFAVMAPDLATVTRYCTVPQAARDLLSSPAAPIVILDVREPTDPALPLDLLTPDTPTLGAMLPTTPLHALLLQGLPDDPTPPFDLLVMTSGNRRGEPICLSDAEACARLGDIADLVLTHNRDINLRCDDSVAVLQGERPQVWRRARGHAPAPLPLPTPVRRCVLAFGAELKNTLALAAGARVVLSPHIGDLETPEALAGLEQVADCFPRFLGLRPEAVAVDLHPDMHATRIGEAFARRHGLPICRVQHHHAHAAAALAEHGLEAGLALVFDGTGYGLDGAIWGAEMLEVSRETGMRRLGTFLPAPLPGGDAAVRAPVRQLLARWLDAGVAADAIRPRLGALGVTEQAFEVWRMQCARGLNTVASHAAGRLFDAFAAACGAAPGAVSYEGQAAIRLEALARRHRGPLPGPLPFAVAADGPLLRVDWRPLFDAPDRLDAWRRDPPGWALAFHAAVADAAAQLVAHALTLSPLRVVALSGGVFMNRILTALVCERLTGLGVTVLVPGEVPPNDGGIALGQAVVAGAN